MEGSNELRIKRDQIIGMFLAYSQPCVYFGVCLITLIYICGFISIGVTEVDILGPYIGGLFVSVSKSIERFAKFASLSWHMWNYRDVFITLSLQKAHAAVAL